MDTFNYNLPTNDSMNELTRLESAVPIAVPASGRIETRCPSTRCVSGSKLDRWNVFALRGLSYRIGVRERWFDLGLEASDSYDSRLCRPSSTGVRWATGDTAVSTTFR